MYMTILSTQLLFTFIHEPNKAVFSLKPINSDIVLAGLKTRTKSSTHHQLIKNVKIIKSFWLTSKKSNVMLMLACLSSGSGEGPLPKIYEGGVIKERKCMLRDL